MLRAIKLVFTLLALVYTVLRTAFSYIDPNTGGMLFQLLAFFLAAFSALILFFSRQLRVGLARVMRFVRGVFNKSE